LGDWTWAGESIKDPCFHKPVLSMRVREFDLSRIENKTFKA
jgi:hypothetical protein